MSNRPEQNPTERRRSALDRLVGEWQMVGTHPAFEAAAHGRSTFEWLSDGGLLVWRFEWESPGPPSAISVIGWDDGGGPLTVLYSDVRGVYRIYLMELDGGTWTMHRESPGFSQRMSGSLSPDGKTIAVRGELTRDGVSWEGDLNVEYTRVR